ncbi:MAG TPA: S53 family peptidase [Streptosporangiales bacterium]
MHKHPIAATLLSAAALVAGVLTAPAANASVVPKAVPDTKPAWLARATHLGHAGSAAKVDARVYLAPRGGLAALQRQALAVSTPGDARYGHFLTAAQYQATYGVTDAAVNAVENWLRSAGLTVTGVGAGRSYVRVRGTVRQAEQAFDVTIDRYRHDGQTVQAPTSAVRVPGRVASSVLTVTGLDSSVSVAKPASTVEPPPPGFRNARPCSVFYGQLEARFQADFKTRLPAFKGQRLPYAVCGYTGPQLRAAYEPGTDLDGTGATVAIVDAYDAPTIVGDAQRYAVENGDGGYAKNQLRLIDAARFTHQNLCVPTGWAGEQTLDIEAVHAMAPGADIRYYGAASCEDVDLIDTLAKVVDQDKAQIVTNSWGEPEEGETTGSIAKFEQVFAQGAVEGISFTFSSGDSGDELANTGIRQADYPTSDPFVTSVGGTSLAVGADGSRLFETGWGTDEVLLSANGKRWAPDEGFTSGAGGGVSHLFDKPAYQNGTVPGAHRQVPDVGMDADPTTGFLVGETQTFPEGVSFDTFRLGGTSLASPLFAGMTALAIGARGGTGLGLLNPTIYANPSAFDDVTGAGADIGNVRVDFDNGVDASKGVFYSVRQFDMDSSLTTGPGWDDVTGLGSPNDGWLDLARSAG